jgi:hypothetical protein
MKAPRFVTHYYLPENGPFLSLSDLPLGQNDPAFLAILSRYKHDSGYRRRYGADYVEKRKRIEGRLRELFVGRGGKPRRSAPFYLVLGESPWFRALNEDHKEIRFELSDLDPDTTSLTYPDSFIALTRADKPYYNQVFLLEEVDEIVERFGIPKADSSVPYERYWESDFELYIEVQIWDDPPGEILA